MENEEKRLALLRLLQANARISNAEVADRLQMTVDEVAAAIAECERERVIRGYHTSVADEVFPDAQVRALIEVNVEPEREVGFDNVARRLSKFPEVTDILLVSGSYDLLLIVVGENLREVANFVAAKLSCQSGVRATHTHFILKRYKEAGFRLEQDDEHERLSVTP